jgi:hypothetical protein
LVNGETFSAIGLWLLCVDSRLPVAAILEYLNRNKEKLMAKQAGLPR